LRRQTSSKLPAPQRRQGKQRTSLPCLDQFARANASILQPVSSVMSPFCRTFRCNPQAELLPAKPGISPRTKNWYSQRPPAAGTTSHSLFPIQSRQLQESGYHHLFLYSQRILPRCLRRVPGHTLSAQPKALRAGRVVGETLSGLATYGSSQQSYQLDAANNWKSVQRDGQWFDTEPDASHAYAAVAAPPTTRTASNSCPHGFLPPHASNLMFLYFTSAPHNTQLSTTPEGRLILGPWVGHPRLHRLGS